MKKVILCGLVLLVSPPALAIQAGNNATTGYASSLPPIYPTEQQQQGSQWGAQEIVRCPDNYMLVFTPPAPATCKPIPGNSLSGGNQ